MDEAHRQNVIDGLRGVAGLLVIIEEFRMWERQEALIDHAIRDPQLISLRERLASEIDRYTAQLPNYATELEMRRLRSEPVEHAGYINRSFIDVTASAAHHLKWLLTTPTTTSQQRWHGIKQLGSVDIEYLMRAVDMEYKAMGAMRHEAQKGTVMEVAAAPLEAEFAGSQLITLDPPRILIEGIWFELKPNHAEYLNALLTAADWMSDAEFRRTVPNQQNARPDQWRKDMPPEVRKRIRTERHGSRWIN